MINKNEILLKSKKKLFLNLTGIHNTIFSGNGLEFKELRGYTTSDDIRHINWKVTSRSLNPTVNIFNEDKQLNIVLVYLNSGSIYFGSVRSKQDTMVETLLSLTQAGILSNDMVSTIFFSEDEDKFYKPTKHKSIIDINLDTAYDENPIGKSINYEKLTHLLLHKIKKKSLIFMMGDFLDFEDKINFNFIASKHEVYCAIIRDKFEENLELSGEFNIVDTNSNDEQNIFLTPTTIKKYNETLKKYDKALYEYFDSCKIKYEKIYTCDDVQDKLNKLVLK